jgi:hypothetical protein
VKTSPPSGGNTVFTFLFTSVESTVVSVIGKSRTFANSKSAGGALLLLPAEKSVDTFKLTFVPVVGILKMRKNSRLSLLAS